MHQHIQHILYIMTFSVLSNLIVSLNLIFMFPFVVYLNLLNLHTYSNDYFQFGTIFFLYRIKLFKWSVVDVYETLNYYKIVWDMKNHNVLMEMYDSIPNP